MINYDYSQPINVAADMLLNKATHDQLIEAVELFAFKYSYFVLRYGDKNLDDLHDLASNDPLGSQMQAIDLESKQAIVSTLSTLMGIDIEEPKCH